MELAQRHAPYHDLTPFKVQLHAFVSGHWLG
jgi:hypothetical protein